jgi:hypothetical protein
MSRTKRIRSTALILGAALAAMLAACSSMAPQTGVVDDEPLNNEEEGIVFGMLVPQVFDSKGKPVSEKNLPNIEYDMFFGSAENVSISRAFTGFHESITGNTRIPQTFFAMKLPAGEYSLFKFYRPFQGTTGYVPTDMRFTVEPNKATYIGSLQIQFRSTKGLLGQERFGEKIAFKVVDDKENAIRMFKERNPHVTQEIATGLLKGRRL